MFRCSLRLVPFTVLAAAIAAGTAACASGPAPDPLAGLTSKQVATKAVTGTEAASSVRITGSGEDSGQSITLDLTEVKGKGCQGSFSEAKLGSFKMVYNGTDVWVLPDAQFYQSENVPSSAVALLNGKWIEVKSNTAGLGSMTQLCSVSGLLGVVSKDASLIKGTKTTFDGQPAIKITDNTGKGYAYVTDTSTPQLLLIHSTGSGGGQLNFVYGGIADAITPPPASQTIDGSKFGL